MNAKQNAKFKMYRAIEQHCEENKDIFKNLVALNNAFTNFKAKIVELETTSQQKNVVLTGIAKDKSNARLDLAQKANDLAGEIFAFASVTGNQTLKQEVKVSLTKILQTSEEQFVSRCRNIHARGTENLVALADYGVTQQNLTNLQTAIDSYVANAPKTRTAKSNRKTLTANLTQLFKDADTILKEQMDKLVVTFRSTNADFVNNYEANRIIIDPSKTTTQLKGKVTNKANGTAIKDVSVTVVEPNITVKTDSKGEYSIKPITVGKYTIKFNAIGFDEKVIDEFEAKLGIVGVLNVGL
jgi:hypothetical protein